GFVRVWVGAVGCVRGTVPRPTRWALAGGPPPLPARVCLGARAPPLAELPAPVVLGWSPAAVPWTSTPIVQVPPTAMVAPLTLRLPAPPVAVTVGLPPLPPGTLRVAATFRPLRRESAQRTPVRARRA